MYKNDGQIKNYTATLIFKIFMRLKFLDGVITPKLLCYSKNQSSYAFTLRQNIFFYEIDPWSTFLTKSNIFEVWSPSLEWSTKKI